MIKQKTLMPEEEDMCMLDRYFYKMTHSYNIASREKYFEKLIQKYSRETKTKHIY